MVCLPVGPRCGECELSDGRCPSASKVSAKTSVRKMTARSSRGGPKVKIEIEEIKTEDIVLPAEDVLSPLSDSDTS